MDDSAELTGCEEICTIDETIEEITGSDDKVGFEDAPNVDESIEVLVESVVDVVRETGDTTLEKDDNFDAGVHEQPVENIVSNNKVKNVDILFFSITFSTEEQFYSASSICCNL